MKGTGSVSFIIVVTILIFFLFLIVRPHLPKVNVSLAGDSHTDSASHGSAGHTKADPTLTEVTQDKGKEKEKSEINWNAYFPKICDDSPDDYPRKVIGACPYSKPQSQPLPFPDMPMCMYQNYEKSLSKK